MTITLILFYDDIKTAVNRIFCLFTDLHKHCIVCFISRFVILFVYFVSGTKTLFLIHKRIHNDLTINDRHFSFKKRIGIDLCAIFRFDFFKNEIFCRFMYVWNHYNFVGLYNQLELVFVLFLRLPLKLIIVVWYGCLDRTQNNRIRLLVDLNTRLLLEWNKQNTQLIVN